MKIIILSIVISLLTIGVLAATDIKIAEKTLTPIQYSTLKTNLITKYQTKGFFTPNEWQDYVAVLDKEAKEGKLSNLKDVTKQNLISKINAIIK